MLRQNEFLELNHFKESLVVIADEGVPPSAHEIESYAAGPIVRQTPMVLLALAGFWREENS